MFVISAQLFLILVEPAWEAPPCLSVTLQYKVCTIPDLLQSFFSLTFTWLHCCHFSCCSGRLPDHVVFYLVWASLCPQFFYCCFNTVNSACRLKGKFCGYRSHCWLNFCISWHAGKDGRSLSLFVDDGEVYVLSLDAFLVPVVVLPAGVSWPLLYTHTLFIGLCRPPQYLAPQCCLISGICRLLTLV